MGYRDALDRFPTTPIGGWILRNIARHLDPVLYRWSGGRLTALGPQWVPSGSPPDLDCVQDFAPLLM